MMQWCPTSINGSFRPSGVELFAVQSAMVREGGGKSSLHASFPVVRCQDRVISNETLAGVLKPLGTPRERASHLSQQKP